MAACDSCLVSSRINNILFHPPYFYGKASGPPKVEIASLTFSLFTSFSALGQVSFSINAPGIWLRAKRWYLYGNLIAAKAADMEPFNHEPSALLVV